MMKKKWADFLGKSVEAAFLTGIFVLPFSKALLEICLTITFVLWFLMKLIQKENLYKDQTLFFLVGSFTIISSISGFYSGYPLLSALGIIKLIKYSLVMLIAAETFRDRTKVKHLILVSCISFFGVVLDSVYQYFIGKDLIAGFEVYHSNLQIRLTGPFESYGLLAAYLLILIPVITAIVIGTNKNELAGWKKFLLAFFLVLGFLVFFKTHSRGAWIAFAGGALICASLLRKKWIFSLIIISLFVAPFVLPKNVLVHRDVQQKEQSLKERYQLWRRAWDVIKSQPFFGCGINTYVKNYSKFDTKKHWRVPGYYVHNGYLQLAAETGLIALGLFLGLLFLALKVGVDMFKKTVGARKFLLAGLITGATALLFQAVIDTTLHNLQSAYLIWLSIGLLFASSDFRKKQTHERN